MRCRLLVALLLVSITPSLRAQDDEDRMVDGKRASEWFVILRTDKQLSNRRKALLAIERAGPLTRKIFEEVGASLRLDSDEGIRAMSGVILGSLGAKARDVQSLTRIPVKPGVDALIASLGKEKSAKVRNRVAVALGRFGTEAKDAVPALGAALKDAEPEVRASAAESLFKIGPDAKGALKELAAAVKENNTKELLNVRLNAAMALQRIGRPDGLPAVSELIAALKEAPLSELSPDERRLATATRRQMIETLGTLGDVAAVDILTDTLEKALTSKDTSLGRTALTALTKLAGDRKALLPTLVKAMAPDPKLLQDPLIRCEAMHALGQIGKDLGSYREEVVQKLIKGLSDRLSEVRLAAIFALGELGAEVVGRDLAKKIIEEHLVVLKRSTEKPISEAAEATIQKLQK